MKRTGLQLNKLTPAGFLGAVCPKLIRVPVRDGYFGLLRLVSFGFEADANVASREPFFLQYKEAADLGHDSAAVCTPCNIVGEAASTHSQSANTFCRYSGQRGVTGVGMVWREAAMGQIVSYSLLTPIWEGAFTLEFDASNIQVGDNWTRLRIEYWESETIDQLAFVL